MNTMLPWTANSYFDHSKPIPSSYSHMLYNDKFEIKMAIQALSLCGAQTLLCE